MKYALILLMLLVSACASNPHKAEYLNTKIEKSSAVGRGSVIGVKEGKMIYQKKVYMGEQLRDLQISTFELEAKVYGGRRYYDNNGLIGALRMCRAKLASPELGGDGKMSWTESRDYVIPDEDFGVLGLNEADEIIGLQEEFLKDRITRFVKYRKVLEGREDELNNKIEACQIAVNAASARSVAARGE